MNPQLRSRLENWKFNQALSHLEGESREVKDIVEALARSFGNCGWIEGDQGTIIGYALTAICRIE